MLKFLDLFAQLPHFINSVNNLVFATKEVAASGLGRIFYSYIDPLQSS